MRKFLLLVIFCIAIFLRFFHLGQNPPSLTWDEAAWGYNAYSIGIDGKDEFGRFLPLNYLESFGDFKPPMYAYLTVLPVKIFGLTEFATRFPSALFGSLTVLLTYFLVLELFSASKKKYLYGLISSAILAISPWHIMLSRAAFEANVAVFFLVLGIWLFLKGVNRNAWYWIGSFISLVCCMYTFNSVRVVAPLVGIFLLFIFKKSIMTNKKQFIVAIVISFISILPTLTFLFSPQASLRFKEVNIFSDSSVVTTSNQEVRNDNNVGWSKIIHNRRFLFTLSFLRHYFDNLSPNFLFIQGDGNPKFSTQDVGELYLWDLPFFILGMLLLFKRKEGYWYIIPIWLLLAIFPAATARETPHALRIENALPTFQILTGYGFANVLIFLHSKKFKWKYVAFGIFGLTLMINVGYFLHGYYTHYGTEYSGEWQYGYKQSIQYVQENQASYDQIAVTTSLGRPYIYYLFYTKTNPQVFRSMAIIKRDAFGFVNIEGFGKYKFYDTFPAKNATKKILYVNTPDNVPKSATVLKKFLLLNNKPALVAYTL